VDAALVIEYNVWSNPYYHQLTAAVETVGNIDYVYATKVTRGVMGYLATAAGLVAPSGLLTATIGGQALTLDYAANAHGLADVTVRATDTQNLSVEDTFRVTVNPVNDAPMLDNTGAMTLAAIDEDDVTNPGTLVRGIVLNAGGDRISDVDYGALEGMAVTAVDNTHGTWQFTVNNGRTWQTLGSPTAATARLLGSDAGTRIRFVPHSDWHGTVDPGLTFRAWDHTTGFNGGTADASLGGGATAFSAAAESAAITVRPVNDPSAVTLANAVAALPESTNTAVRIKVADIVITDDGLGLNLLSLAGPDRDLFEIDGLVLYLRAGVGLDFETQPWLQVTVQVDDPGVGTTPDGTADLSLAITDVPETLIVSQFTGTLTGFVAELNRALEPRKVIQGKTAGRWRTRGRSGRASAGPRECGVQGITAASSRAAFHPAWKRCDRDNTATRTGFVLNRRTRRSPRKFPVRGFRVFCPAASRRACRGGVAGRCFPLRPRCGSGR
jgi:hypothetical protein